MDEVVFLTHGRDDVGEGAAFRTADMEARINYNQGGQHHVHTE